jgi:hypothetical protein
MATWILGGIVDIEKIVAVYLKIRDEKHRVAQEALKRDAELKAKMARLEAEIQRELNRLNVQSVRTGAGTAFQKLEVKPSCKDWGMLDAWAQAEGVPPSEVFEKRLSRKFVTDYMAAHDGETPAPVTVHRELTVHVRRGD